MSEKLCVFCRHWQFSGGEPGYSELTPGVDASMDCAKGRWTQGRARRFRLSDLYSPEEFRAKIKIAATCADYDEAKP